ncbi:MutS protein 1 [Desmophyllum pertusum]|uniref:MutS protein 1 n=1 Tax=Desmophyllum pertusum TaxID=174260 RepID=A0A9X0CTI1_9CNID|nr:MutS protein 1 [Desmophyllum pertusum]
MAAACAKFSNCGRTLELMCRTKIFRHIDKFMATSSSALPDKNVKMTGLSKQYLSIKNKYPDFIVLFQVGDFYEIYSGDAVKVAEKTSLRISRNPNVNKLMAGFPVRSLDSWLTTLVQQGFQLAICPQFPDKTPAKSRLLHREVIRLVTPGTLLDPLKPDANYLMSIAQGPDSSLGLAWLDVSTGDFHLGVSSLANVEEDLSRVNPAEVGVALWE